MKPQDVQQMHQALYHEPLPDAVAVAVNKYSVEQAKADFLAYKAGGGDMCALEWCYFNAPDLFAKWQAEGQVDGDWIYYPAPGQEVAP